MPSNLKPSPISEERIKQLQASQIALEVKERNKLFILLLKIKNADFEHWSQTGSFLLPEELHQELLETTTLL